MYRVRLGRSIENLGGKGLVVDVDQKTKDQLVESGGGEVEAFVPVSRMVKPIDVDVRVSGEPSEEGRVKGEEKKKK